MSNRFRVKSLESKALVVLVLNSFTELLYSILVHTNSGKSSRRCFACTTFQTVSLKLQRVKLGLEKENILRIWEC